MNKKQFSQNKMAKLLGMSRPTYAKVLKGEKKLTKEQKDILNKVQTEEARQSAHKAIQVIDLPISQIEEIFETLQDQDLLNEKGLSVRRYIWSNFVKIIK